MSFPPAVFELCASFFLIKTVHNFLLLILTSLFLKAYGPSGLPWVYVLSNILFILTQFFIFPLGKKKGHAYLSACSRPFMAFVAFLTLLEIFPNSVLVLCSLLFMLTYDINATRSFSDMTGQVLPIRDVKKYLPSIYSFGTAGSIISGIGLTFLLDFCSFSQVYGLILILLIFYDRCLSKIEKFIVEERISCEGNVENVLVPDLRGETLKFAKVLMLASFLAFFCRLFTEFLYTTGVTTLLASEKGLASFLGIFGAFIDISVAILQATVVGKLFSAVPLGFIIAIRALGMIAISIGGIVFPHVYWAMTAQFFLMLTTKSFVTPAFVILLEPIPKVQRTNLRKLIAVVDSSAQVIGGLFLILFLKRTDAQTIMANSGMIFGVIAFFFLCLLFFTKKIDDGYNETVKETLESTEAKGDLELIDTIRFIPKTERLKRLNDLLSSADPNVRFNAIIEMQEFPPEEAGDLILTKISRENVPKNFLAACRVLMEKLGNEAVEILEDFLSHEQNHRLSADMLEILATLGAGERIVSIVQKYLDHPNHRVRGNALLGVLRFGSEPSILEKALEALISMIKHPEPFFRSSAAIVMGSTGLAMFVPTLAQLADDPQEEVKRNAINSLAMIKTAGALEVLSRKKKEPGNPGKWAMEAWESVSQNSFEEIIRVLHGLSTQERIGLSSWLNQVRDNEAFAVMHKVLHLEECPIRENLIQGLRSFDRSRISMLSKCLVVDDREMTRIDMSVLIDALRENGFNSLPPWSDLISMLGGSDFPEYNTFLKESLRELWKEIVFILKGREFKSSLTGIDLEARKTSIKDKIQVIFHLCALGTAEPAQVLDAIGKAKSRDNFLVSLALEYLESKFDPEKSGLLIPLLNWENSPAQLLSQAAQKCGIDPHKLSEDSVMSFFMRSCL